jgi:lactoylglutathione lyase
MVNDLERSLPFYRDILGLQVREVRKRDNGPDLAFITVGRVEIELIAGSANPYHNGDGIVNHFAFRVDDLDAALAHLRAHDVEIISPQPIAVDEHMRVAFFRGPDGEKLEFVEMS